MSENLNINGYNAADSRVYESIKSSGITASELAFADKNSDGTISEDELSVYIEEDSSNSGAISKNEEIALLQAKYNNELTEKRRLQQEIINLTREKGNIQQSYIACEDSEQKSKLKSKLGEIDDTINSANDSISQCSSNMQDINKSIIKALTNSSTQTEGSVSFSGGTSGSFSGVSASGSIPQELAQKLDQKLGSGFSQKCQSVANSLGCNPNDLLAMMFSESGINPNLQASNGATGLIMFMPSTLSANGYSVSQVKNMSGVEQLDVVEKILKASKSMSGYGENEKIDAGTLYALCFLPAAAKNEVLCTTSDSLSWAYSANSPLDADKNGDISKTDLASRLQKKYQEMYQSLMG